jgi:hypothetical protein
VPSVLKSDPRAQSTGELVFTEWAYGGWKPNSGQPIAWFTPESEGGLGLFALGVVTRDAVEAGKNAKGNALVQFSASFDRFNPARSLRKEHFRALPRIGAGSPIQLLNRCLYMNSHVKVAEIDDETFRFLLGHFSNS